ncbi:MAG: epoxyqueuosine reductase QueH [Clostridia bacterium]|nr:epoxyqueuosine reductase QueH [Clostridia bacterium]
MSNKSFIEEFDKTLNSIDKLNKPKLLLHSCCAPCSSACLEVLMPYFDITVFYFNPNISDPVEYDKRLNEQVRYCKNLNIDVINGDYNPDVFFNAVRGLETAKEGGDRCTVCYKLRLEETAKQAKLHGYDYFCSTLSVSPYKNAEKLNNIGVALEGEYCVKYLINDFKKRNGYKRSVELSSIYSLYRQPYCGCVFSKRETVK